MRVGTWSAVVVVVMCVAVLAGWVGFLDPHHLGVQALAWVGVAAGLLSLGCYLVLARQHKP